jgi:hypothetical protein
MQAGRFVIFVTYDCDRVLAKRDESAHAVLRRILCVQSVSPNRIELMQLIVQRVAAILCHQDGVFIIRELTPYAQVTASVRSAKGALE